MSPRVGSLYLGSAFSCDSSNYLLESLRNYTGHICNYIYNCNLIITIVIYNYNNYTGHICWSPRVGSLYLGRKLNISHHCPLPKIPKIIIVIIIMRKGANKLNIFHFGGGGPRPFQNMLTFFTKRIQQILDKSICPRVCVNKLSMFTLHLSFRIRLTFASYGG